MFKALIEEVRKDITGAGRATMSRAHAEIMHGGAYSRSELRRMGFLPGYSELPRAERIKMRQASPAYQRIKALRDRRKAREAARRS